SKAFIVNTKQVGKPSDRYIWTRLQSRTAIEQMLGRVVGGISHERAWDRLPAWVRVRSEAHCLHVGRSPARKLSDDPLSIAEQGMLDFKSDHGRKPLERAFSFPIADHAGVIARRLESKRRACQIDAKRGSWVYNAHR